MATTFQVTISAQDADETYAAQSADAVFAEVARLESELSRFRDASDIGRLQHLPAGEPFRLGLAAWDCLALAKAVHEETAGAFDITIGPLMHLWRNADGTPRRPGEEELAQARRVVGTHLFDLDPEQLQITLKAAPMSFDLGAVGKGYALDQAADLLRSRGVHHALLNAGDSTVLAIGDAPGTQGWPVTLGGGDRALVLKDRALSGSGFAVKGGHIMNPRTFAPVPIKPVRTYALAPTAALSDALSTAFMIMGESEIATLCARYPEVTSWDASTQ